MSTAATTDHVVTEADRDGGSLAARLRSVAALLVPALVFWYVGGWVAQPNDPLAPVTLLLVPNRFLVMIEMVGLAVVSAGLATAINGPRSAMYGPLGVAVGLAAVSIRGGDADLLPLCLPAALAPWPTRALIFEIWLWLGLIALGAVVGRWVDSWSSSSPPEGAPRDVDDEIVDSAVELRRAMLMIPVVAVLAYLLVQLFAGSPASPLLKGQVFFSVGAAFYVAVALAGVVLKVRSPMWMLMSVAIVGTVAHVLAAPDVTPELAARGVRVVLNGLVRPTPMQYAALGTIGVWLAHLSSPGRGLIRSGEARHAEQAGRRTS